VSSLDPVVEDESFDNNLGSFEALRSYILHRRSHREGLREVDVTVVVVLVRRRLGLVAELTSSGFPDAEISPLDY